MKRISLLAIFSAVFIIYSIGQESEIKFEKTEHDFGTIKEENGVVKYSFKFENTGDAPLVIKNVKASCGCTTPSWPKRPIGPGEKETVTAAYNPHKRPGYFKKSITIMSNAKNSPKVIYISGTVTPKPKGIEDLYPFEVGDLRFKTSHIAFSKIQPKAQKTETMEIVNTGKNNVTLSFKNVPKHIQLSVEPSTIGPNQKAKIIAKYDAAKIDDWGLVVSRIHIQLDGSNKETNQKLAISATIEENFSEMSEIEIANAPKIVFKENLHNYGEIKTGELVKHNFTFTNEGKTDLIIHKVKASCGCTATDPEKNIIKPGESSHIAVTFNSKGRSGKQQKYITVITNDPNNQYIKLKISGTVIR